MNDLGLGDRPTRDHLEQRVEQQREPAAAGVDDARLACRTGSSSGVRAPRRRAAASAASSMPTSACSPASRAASAASAAARTTVRIVPSTGRITASYAASDALRMPAAKSGRTGELERSGTCRRGPAGPARGSRPELPRAPISEPWATAWQTSAMSSAVPSSWTTDSRVRVMFVPVSPSGTGYTLSRFSSSWWERRASRNRVIACRRSRAASRSRVAIGAHRTGRAFANRGPLLSFPGSAPGPERGHVMASVCEVCGKSPVFGKKLSHSHRRTKRRWNPNVQKVRAIVNGSPKRLHVCTACLKAGKVQKP